MLSILPTTPTGATVSVKAVHLGRVAAMPSSFFYTPTGVARLGSSSYTAPIYAFLIEGKERVMFDLGIRKDEQTYPPRVQKAYAGMRKTGPVEFEVDQEAHEKLPAKGVSLDSVKAVIWSHRHIDHIGDMSKFPSTTRLVVGEETELRPYPELEMSGITHGDIDGRDIQKIPFSSGDLTIAGLRAFDYFSDGSLYILDTPGHCAGHVSALARVTPSTFVLLGGDCCHHPGSLRPSPHHAGCPFVPADTPTLPLGDGMYDDVDTARNTVEKLAVLDANEDVLTLLAHDDTLSDVMKEIPDNVDDWKEKGWKSKVMWKFKENLRGMAAGAL
ncbi:Metallo-hydrolase/oxidoreductase [Cylindrobasidium torrendii FP15055 ss-10]|uniref:Metallo-hydrolase/oxidoreductase n=1 Tax=Cylindrobasidium torrendii FP15055 ss-10 TaxID=1314674 RepID=A0A0D7B964_9AGAR|nr:Metallo-hydrolase/oxidoreductase [Cylindrobasidium torrendii FP15055 ss-10]